MSLETVQEIIRKAITDEEYRELMFSDPDKALEGFDLTDEEAAELREMEREQFDAVKGELEERVSRAGFGLGLRSGKLTDFKNVLRNKGISQW